MPAKTEKSLGGHAVLIVGYDDAKRQFRVRNSWGPSWGLKGYFLMPYDYVVNPNLASDFWVLQQISG
jgi:C1A family cysteine protease